MFIEQNYDDSFRFRVSWPVADLEMGGVGYNFFNIICLLCVLEIHLIITIPLTHPFYVFIWNTIPHSFFIQRVGYSGISHPKIVSPPLKIWPYTVYTTITYDVWETYSLVLPTKTNLESNTSIFLFENSKNLIEVY